jgi:DNA-nicking Smr family endonuclease
MSKPKNNNIQKDKLRIKWEDQELPSKLVLTKSSADKDAELFHEAIKIDKIRVKDEDTQPTKSNKSPPKKRKDRHDIDLHGLTVEQAQKHVIRSIEHILDDAKGQPVNIRVITGKGNRSRERGPQLIHSIHHVVEARFKSRIISIDVSPHELKIGDSYLKGHFDLKIR